MDFRCAPTNGFDCAALGMAYAILIEVFTAENAKTASVFAYATPDRENF